MKKSILLTTLLFAAAHYSTQAANAPSDGTAYPAGPKTIALHWTDNSSDETGFEISDDVGTSVLASVPANQTYFYDRTITTPETSKTYHIRATGAANSTWVLAGSATTTIQMNILFFLADDMGYKDIVALRNPEIDGATIYETPALDTLVSQSLSINNAYCSGPRCVVARRCIQTGKYDWRPEAVPNNGYYIDHAGDPIGGGIWAGGITVAGSKAGAGVTIPYDNVTYGEAVKAVGYRTCFIGKYHLGESPSATPVLGYTFGDQPGRGPIDQGYDVSIAAGHAGAPPASYFAVELMDNSGSFPVGTGNDTFELPDMDTADYGTAAPIAGEYITDRMTTKAIGFIQDAITNHSTHPFHLTLAHYAVHTPAEAPTTLVDHFKTRKSNMAAELADHPMASTPLAEDYSVKTRQIQDNVVYAAMIKSYDQSLADLRAYLAITDDPRHPSKKLSETTILVVSSDHGGKSTTPIADNHSLEDTDTALVNAPATYDATTGKYKAGRPNDFSHYPTANYPYRQGKTWVYEGGLKVPLIIYVPGLSPSGIRSNAFIHHADLFATFCDMAGAPIPTETNDLTQTAPTDSISFMLTAANPDFSARKDLHHFFTNANKGTGNPALAAYRKGNYKLLYYIVQRKLELYNLASDISEKNDLVESRPDLAEQMFLEIYQQAVSTGMKMPSPGTGTWTSEVNDVLLRNGLISSVPARPDAAPTWDGGVTQLSNTTVELSWNVNATNADYSVIYRQADADGESRYREIAFLPADQATFRDTNLKPGGKYRYRVESENLGGWTHNPDNPDDLSKSTNTGNQTIILSTSVGDLAIAANDDSITTVPGETREFNPLMNDEGEGELAITAITQPIDGNGSPAGTATTDGKLITFNAPSGFAGNLTMTYTVTDTAAQSAIATVTFTLPIQLPNATAIEHWDFSETAGTQLENTSSVTGLQFGGTTAATIATNGNGVLLIQADGNTYNKYAGAIAGGTKTNGQYQLEYYISSADLTNSANGVSFGFALRDSSTNTDFGMVRIRKNNGTPQLEVRANNSNNVVHKFNTATISNIIVYSTLDLDASPITITTELSINGEAPISRTTYNATSGAAAFDTIKFTKNNTWTTPDAAAIDDLKILALTPASTLYDSWSSTFPWKGVLENAPEDDPDGDGIKNIVEFAFGLSPTEANAQSELGVTLDPTDFTFNLTPWRDTALLNYTIQFSDNLTVWDRTDSFVPFPITTPAGTPVSEPLPTGLKVFSRVQITNP